VWTEVNFGKWKGKGKTLPQIIVSDPDWFFWAQGNGALKGVVGPEGEALVRRSVSIKIPSTMRETHCVAYTLSHDGKFYGFDLIPKDQPEHHGSSSQIRKPTLDLSAPRHLQRYDKTGCKLMLSTFKYYWFGNKSFTKKRVEEFFDDPGNFVRA